MKIKQSRCIQVFLSIVLLSCLKISFAEGMKAKKVDWIPEIFPSIDHCTPKSLYFDMEKGESNQGQIEMLGYTRPTLRGEVADYKVDEEFFGYHVDLLSIPRGTSSVYALRISAKASELAKEIQKATGKKIQIINKGKPKSGVAYLTPISNEKTIFVCFTYEY